MEKYLTLTDVCRELSISRATAKNWIRLGKLVPDKGGLFGSRYIEQMTGQLHSGENPRLKARRNKQSISGKSLYKDYISHAGNRRTAAEILEMGLELEEGELRYMLARFAERFYEQSSCGCHPEVFCRLVRDLRGTEIPGLRIRRELEAVLEMPLEFMPGEDTLGFIYLSLKDMGKRKRTGAYYTPSSVVRRLLDELRQERGNRANGFGGETFCDPCCGTGNFLMCLAENGAGAEDIYGQDLDELSVLIARINVALLCPEASYEMICSRIVCGDALRRTFSEKFDVILGNPPWGFDFSREEMKELKNGYRTASGNRAESFELFTELGLSMLKEGGALAYVLPEAVLTVAVHRGIRELLLEQAAFRFVTYLGNTFFGVQCPSVILGVRRERNCLVSSYGDGGRAVCGCRVSGEVRGRTINYMVGGGRKIFADGFPFHVTDGEAACLRAIEQAPNVRYLKGRAVFAMGIVTGDNKEKVKDAPGENLEPVLSGSDVNRYRLRTPEKYLCFLPEQLQQVAPEEHYRAPEKLVYRFISDIPVFAYDNRQMLTLNSCNILIPRIEGLQMKYVLAVLNSSVAAFYISRKYNSMKMLKSHLECLPIPAAGDQVQEEIVQMADYLMAAKSEREALYEELDRMVMELYGLNEACRKMIAEAMKNKKRFL